jgi:hypothetical protein
MNKKEDLKERENEKQNSLWNNSMITSALNAMSDEDRENYKKLGESMFADINFETASITDKNNVPLFLNDAASYICESIKSGLHPSMLTDDEKIVMENVLGKEWYKKYDYTKEDLDDIVTLQKSNESESKTDI